MQKYIRIAGIVSIGDSAKSDIYFNGIPRESKIGAWSSPQSKKIDSREALEKIIEGNTEKFKEQEIPRPEFWGG